MKIGFYSTLEHVPWGGSEHLWSRAARCLLGRGREVAARCQWWPPAQRAKQLQRLAASGARVAYRGRLGPTMQKVRRLVRATLRKKGLQKKGAASFAPGAAWLRREAPDLLLIAMTGDDAYTPVARTCHRRGVPYALLIQASDPYRQIPDAKRARYRALYENAEACFFVSRANRELLERKLARRLDTASVVENPVLVKNRRPLPWPAADPVWRMACVGRLNFEAKAQDLVLRVLGRRRWRRRPVHVSFYGKDCGNETQLRALIQRRGLQEKVHLAGFAPREEIWRDHHALLLPSRYEGMPLATLEAASCGRVPVVTRCARRPDIVRDGETGFVARAPTAGLLEEAMERAWQRRHEWQAMGRRAACRMCERYSATPVEDFADKIEALVAATAT